MEIITSGPPSNNVEFDQAYSSLSHWTWSDIRIPRELKELIETCKPRTSLELGCGLGRFSRFVASRKVEATGVDFSAVAIYKADQRVAEDKHRPTYLVGDVTDLKMLSEPFDVSFDVGCFHCLTSEGQQSYVKEVHRLLKPGGTHLVWALDQSPNDMKLSPEYIKKIFGNGFRLQKSQRSRRRVIFVPSHWYWLVRL
ncbi:class I SAM-dependent methyltransferase [Dysgonomonas macrotermitis]|uniref:Methyltransferase domain-containing protein n=1 Tax=Dysgonomonas macrotermitis TaxID=1346286 RepID=A0A1M4ZBQ2_9BACT|nr:class I SAM-dependent methyltransferase [Dysgonomonas macrotermitis]SHF15212.1 Methyltransferase domain-containing protein [Dysgonomonas macrotermitis]